MAFLNNDIEQNRRSSPEKNKIDSISDTSQTGLNIKQNKYIDKDRDASNLNGIQNVEINMGISSYNIF